MYSAFNISYSHRWRNVGIILGCTVFNVSCLPCCSPLANDVYFPKVVAIFTLTYVFRIRKGTLLPSLKRS
jgi:ATP-binding cassette subfamily G (WHITE) protein 2 (SNQ2)